MKTGYNNLVSAVIGLGLTLCATGGAQAVQIIVTSMTPVQSFDNIDANTPLEFWVFTDNGQLAPNQIEVSAMQSFAGNPPELLAGTINGASVGGVYNITRVFTIENSNIGFAGVAYTLYSTNITKQSFCAGRNGIYVIHMRAWGGGVVSAGDLGSLGIGPGNGAPTAGPGWDNRWVTC